MSVIPNQQAVTSAIGVNSDNAISGGNWTVNTYLGSGEQNDFSYVGINLQVDEAGTLTLEFSQDGTNWSEYPTVDFTISSGINEVHGAWKGTRYVRPKFIGTGGRTFFRLRTMYSYEPVTLTAPLNQPIGSDQDASIVRAVTIGQNPTGTYNNAPADGLGFSTTSLLTSGQQFASGVLDMSKYTQVQTDILSDKNGTVLIEFSADDIGDVVRTITIPYVGGSGFKMFSAPAFTPYVEYKFTCDEAGQTDFYFDTKFTTKSISGQILGMEDFIAPGMVSNLGRNVIVGTDPSGTFVNQKTDGVAFRTEVPLGIAGVYTSPVTSTEGYSQIETHLFSDVAGTLVGRWYNDESKTTLIRTFTRPYSGNEVGTVSYFSSPVFGPYLEYEYTNGSVGQASFFMDFHNRIKPISGQVLGMNDFIPGGVVANLGRNVIVGQDAQGTFRNTTVNFEGDLDVAIADPVSAFGDLRTVELTPQVQLQFPYNINTDIIDITELNGATIVSENSMAKLSSSTSTNGTVVMESIRQIKYRSGLGALARFTTLYENTGVAGATQIAGVGDGEDGFFFGYDGTSFGIMTRRATVDTWVAQTAWSEDTMDGNGPTKMTLDHTKLNVFAIEYQWLGAGEIDFKIEDTETGKYVTVHKIRYTNLNILPSTFNPSFPLHMSITKTSGAIDIVMKAASMAGFVEGKSVVTGPINTFDGNSTHSAETAFFSLQNVSTYIGVKNRVTAFLTSLGIANDVNQLATFRVYLNATLAGTPTWVNVNGTNSVMQSDIVQTYVSGGKILFAATIGKDSGENFIFPDEKYALRPGDIITITSESASSNAMAASINWQEDF